MTNHPEGGSAGNLWTRLPVEMPKEIIDLLLQTRHFWLERIISWGQTTPEGEWYDQDTNEWVVLLTGGAELRFADDPQPLRLRPGDYVHIPAHRRHRVTWTDPGQATVWLALHYRDKSSQPE